jgi:hypothetical protein
MEWTIDIIEILEKIRKNSYSLHNKHRRRYIKFKRLSKYFDLPILISSVFSSSFSSLNIIDSSISNIITTVISMFITILTSIKLYLNLNNMINEENSISKDYYILSIDIYKILLLEPKNRGVEPLQYLNDTYSTYCKLTESSSILYKNIKKDELVIDTKNLISGSSSFSSEESLNSPKNILITQSSNI